MTFACLYLGTEPGIKLYTLPITRNVGPTSDSNMDSGYLSMQPLFFQAETSSIWWS